MSRCVNKVTLIGNLTEDPKVKVFESGDKVCSFSVATSEKWNDRNTGEKRELVQYHNVDVRNKGMAEVCEKFLTKGSRIYLEGELRYRKWEDNEGQTRTVAEVVLVGGQANMTLL